MPTTKQQRSIELRLRARALRAQSAQTTTEGVRRLLEDRAEDLDAEAEGLCPETRRLEA